METAKFTELRARARYYFDKIETGETIRVIRHGKPVADIIPFKGNHKKLYWKEPGVKVNLNGISLSKEIISDRGKNR